MSDTAVQVLGVIAIGLLQIYRESRNRRWLRQDLERRDAEAKVRTGKVLTSIAENTEISKQAFHEANNLNQKFVDIHKRVSLQEEIFREKLAELDAMSGNRLVCRFVEAQQRLYLGASIGAYVVPRIVFLPLSRRTIGQLVKKIDNLLIHTPPLIRTATLFSYLRSFVFICG